MCAPIKLKFPFWKGKSLIDALSNVYQTDVWSVRCIRCIESRAKKLKNKTAKTIMKKERLTRCLICLSKA